MTSYYNSDTGHDYTCFCESCRAHNKIEDDKRQEERNRKEYMQQLANRLLFATIRFNKVKKVWTNPVPSREEFIEFAHAEIEYQKVMKEVEDLE